MGLPQPAEQQSAAAIFARVWDGGTGGLSPVVARHVLKFGFGDTDSQRMQELAERNREAKLTAAELEELDNFVKVGDLLALLQSKVRKAWRSSGTPGTFRPTSASQH